MVGKAPPVSAVSTCRLRCNANALSCLAPEDKKNKINNKTLREAEVRWRETRE